MSEIKITTGKKAPSLFLDYTGDGQFSGLGGPAIVEHLHDTFSMTSRNPSIVPTMLLDLNGLDIVFWSHPKGSVQATLQFYGTNLKNCLDIMGFCLHPGRNAVQEYFIHGINSSNKHETKSILDAIIMDPSRELPVSTMRFDVGLSDWVNFFELSLVNHTVIDYLGNQTCITTNPPKNTVQS